MIRPALSAVLLLAGAAALADEPRFYDRAGEGWFWYRDPPPEPEPDPAPVAPPQAEAPAPPAAPAGPKPLSSAWLKAAIPTYIERAIDAPTPANVRVALYLQRIASDKAAQYAELTQMVTLGDPFLDSEFERPLSNFAAQEVDRGAYRARAALLSHLAGEVGLMWFYRSDCPFCERQAPVMQAIAHATGLEVMTVSLDGAPMPSGAFAGAYLVDHGQAAALGVQTTPTIYVMRPASGDIEMVAQGMMELRDLEARILLVARRRGWISQEAFDATRAVNRTTIAVAPADLDPATLDDPDAFIAHLRDAMRLAPTRTAP